MKTRVFLGAIFLMSSPVAIQALPAFYGAEGGGALSKGGRGGAVCQVTNLNNSGTGSLRACVEMSGPRTVVFRVGGTINLTSRMAIDNPYITIAGHTAPGGGIQITGQVDDRTTLYANTQHIIIRYLTFRKGRIEGSDHAHSNIASHAGFSQGSGGQNVIYDHLSLSWTNGNSISGWGVSEGIPKNITIQNSILAEGLRGRSMGTNFGAGSGDQALDMTDIDIHKNLYARNGWRLPLFKAARGRIINNIIYTWWMYSTNLNGGTHVDVINNLYKNPDPDNVRTKAEILVSLYDENGCAINDYIRTRDPSIYAAGNQGPFYGTDNWNMVRRNKCVEDTTIYGPLESQYRRSSPLAPVGVPITVIPTEQLEDYLYPIVGNSRRLDCMGNWVNKRDSQDARIVNQAKTNHNPNFVPGRSSWGIYSEKDVGGFPTIAGGTPCQDSDGDGMPDVWEDAMGLKKNDPSDRNKLHPTGYTMLEMYLNGPMTTTTNNTMTIPSNVRFVQ